MEAVQPNRLPPRVRIESDGTPQGTRVLIDGKEAENVRRVEWSVGLDGIAAARIEFIGVELAADGNLAPAAGLRIGGPLVLRGATDEQCRAELAAWLAEALGQAAQGA